MKKARKIKLKLFLGILWIFLFLRFFDVIKQFNKLWQLTRDVNLVLSIGVENFLLFVIQYNLVIISFLICAGFLLLYYKKS